MLSPFPETANIFSIATRLICDNFPFHGQIFVTLLDALLDYSPVVRRVVRWVGLHSSYDSVNSPNLQSLLPCSSVFPEDRATPAAEQKKQAEHGEIDFC